jgi:subtilisin family serine protease
MGYGNETAYPSPYRTITVGGTMYDLGTYADRDWTCATQPGGCDSRFGPTNPGSNFGPCVSVWAPAWRIHAAGGGSAADYRDVDALGQPTYGPSSGTSFAAPYVAGIVARLLERNPTWTTQQIYQEIANRANSRPNMPDFDRGPIVNRRLVYMSPFE